MKFEINTVIFLVAIIITLVAWAGFELYHQQNNLDIDPNLVRHAESPLDSSFDSDTLKKLYESKDKYYESVTPTPTQS